MEIKEIVENFEFLDNWEDKYRYIIELGESLEPLEKEFKTDEWKVQGCTSQVWLIPNFKDDKIFFKGNSDADITRGILHIVISIFSGKTKAEIANTNIDDIFATLGLEEHLSPNRRNGLYSMIEKIRNYAD